MKRQCIVILISFIIFFYSAFVPASSAQNSTNSLNISDAVTADLAVKGYLDNVSVSYDDGNPADTIAINEDRHWLPASTVKLYVAMYAYKLVEDHQLHMWDVISADAKNVVPNEFVSDELPNIQQDDEVSTERLIKQMIIQSDNTAFNILLDILDRQKITQYIHDLGLTHSVIGSKLNLDDSQSQFEYDIQGFGVNTTTAADYTKAFLLIKNNKIPGANDLFDILKQQKIRYMIPLLLPSNVTVGNKHGDLSPLFHDGAIVISPDKKLSYALSIFTNLGDPNIVAHLSELIYTRNLNLVGQTSQKAPTNENNPPIDPLVALGLFQKTRILGINTLPVQTQPITAADLGITAKDLSLGVNTQSLPAVAIPADSPFHFLVPVWQSLKKSVAFTQAAKTQSQLDDLSLQLAEAKDQKDKGNIQLANQILQDTQSQLTRLAHTPAVQQNPAAQNIIQSTSETRFSILGDELKYTNGANRAALIKEIASQAKSTLKDVQPFIPASQNATNPSQKPLIGQVVNVTEDTATVKTAGGQVVTIPLNNPGTKIRTKDDIIPSAAGGPVHATPIPPVSPIPSNAPVQVGTTVALIGSSTGKEFTPSFIMTNLPRQLVAPQPVAVIKVNIKDKTMVVSENGVPVQVNIQSQTIIKGNDTGVILNAIKPGDVIVVHGTPIVPVQPRIEQNIPALTTMPTTNGSEQKNGVQAKDNTLQIQKPSSNSLVVTPVITPPFTGTKTNAIPTNKMPQTSPVMRQNTQSNTSPGTQGINPGANMFHTSLPSSNTPINQNQQSQQKVPQVIQSTSIHVIEKAQDVKNMQQPPHQSTPPTQSSPAQNAQPQSRPPANNPQPQSSKQQPGTPQHRK